MSDKATSPPINYVVGAAKIVAPKKDPITTPRDIECVVALLAELEALKKTYRKTMHCGKSPILITSRGEADVAHYVSLPDWVVQPIREMIAARISEIDQELINKWGLVNHVTYGWS